VRLRPEQGRSAGTRPAGDRRARRELERDRLRRLARFGIAVIVAGVLADAVGQRVGERPVSSGPASGGSTSSTAPPPMTIAPLPSTPGVAPVVTRVETTDPVVFLTIDDGHTRDPEVLAAFEEVGVPASLFLVDGPVEVDAEFFRSMPYTLVEGHTRTHPDLRTLSEEAQRAEICGNADTLERAFGRRPVLFRPPYGVYDEATQRAAADCGMAAIVLWEESVNAGMVAYRSTPRLRRGDILLMHFRPSFVEELRAITQLVEQAGLRFALLEDYLVPDSVPERAP
jgi:peptidoglycan/xylan/chitin deacetylase (PgdA/CDA1 family)